LSRADGTGELLLAAHHGGAVLSSAGTPPDLAGRMQVGTASVDSLVECRRLRPPDLVKLDVEGAEMEVLEGMVAVIRRWGPTLVLELDDETLEKCEAKVSACQKFLTGLGYSTELLANSYPEGPWYVRHFVARRPAG
jgi:hypothetical protein